MPANEPNREALNRFFTARMVVNARLPYFRALTNGLIPVEAAGLGTVATTPSMHFAYDPDFMLKVSDPLMLGGLLLHELLHHLKQHRPRRIAFGLPDDGPAHLLHLYNIACDLENNRDVEASGLKLPGKDLIGFDPCVCRNFKDKNGTVFPDNLTAETYYVMLLETMPPPPPSGDGKPGDTHGDGSHVGAGRCGSACAARVPGEPDADGGGEHPGQSESEAATLRADVAKAIRDHVAQKGAGSVPGGIARWAEKANEPIPTPWWEQAKRGIQRAVTWAEGQVTTHYNQIARKQSGVGFGMGKPVLPAWRKPIPRVWVGVDTSASMGQADVDTVLSVVDAMIQKTGKKVTFFACDTQMHAQKEVGSWKEAAKLVKGYGGTDFHPVFQAATAARPEQRPQVLVFVTDGQGPAPELEPQGFKTVWLLVGPYARAPCTWGIQVNVGQNVKAPL